MAATPGLYAASENPPFLCAITGDEIVIYGLHGEVPSLKIDAARESLRRLSDAIARLEFDRQHF